MIPTVGLRFALRDLWPEAMLMVLDSPGGHLAMP